MRFLNHVVETNSDLAESLENNLSIESVFGLDEKELEERRERLRALRPHFYAALEDIEFSELFDGWENREYQIQCLLNTQNYLLEGYNVGAWDIPTGGGKTGTVLYFMDKICSLMKLRGKKFKALVLAPLWGAKNNFVQVFDKLDSNLTMNYRVLDGDDFSGLDYKTFEENVMICTSQLLMYEGRFSDIDPKDFDLVIVDESHRFYGDCFKAVREHFQQESNVILMSATRKNYEVGNFFQISIPELCEQKVLADICYRRYEVIEKAFTEEDFQGDFLKESVANDFQYLSPRFEAINLVLKEAFSKKKPEKVLIYLPSIPSSEEYVRQFKSLYPQFADKIVHMDGSMSDNRKKEIINALESGEIWAISNKFVLNESIDVPEIRHFVNADPCKSPFVFFQRLGRVLRRKGDKDVAHIHDIVSAYESLKVAYSSKKRVKSSVASRFLGVKRYSSEYGIMVTGPYAGTYFDDSNESGEVKYIESGKVRSRVIPFEEIFYGGELSFLDNYEKALEVFLKFAEIFGTSIRNLLNFPEDFIDRKEKIQICNNQTGVSIEVGFDFIFNAVDSYGVFEDLKLSYSQISKIRANNVMEILDSYLKENAQELFTEKVRDILGSKNFHEITLLSEKYLYEILFESIPYDLDELQEFILKKIASKNFKEGTLIDSLLSELLKADFKKEGSKVNRSLLVNSLQVLEQKILAGKMFRLIFDDSDLFNQKVRLTFAKEVCEELGIVDEIVLEKEVLVERKSDLYFSIEEDVIDFSDVNEALSLDEKFVTYDLSKLYPLKEVIQKASLSERVEFLEHCYKSYSQKIEDLPELDFPFKVEKIEAWEKVSGVSIYFTVSLKNGGLFFSLINSYLGAKYLNLLISWFEENCKYLGLYFEKKNEVDNFSSKRLQFGFEISEEGVQFLESKSAESEVAHLSLEGQFMKDLNEKFAGEFKLLETSITFLLSNKGTSFSFKNLYEICFIENFSFDEYQKILFKVFLYLQKNEESEFLLVFDKNKDDFLLSIVKRKDLNEEMRKKCKKQFNLMFDISLEKKYSTISASKESFDDLQLLLAEYYENQYQKWILDLQEYINDIARSDYQIVDNQDNLRVIEEKDVLKQFQFTLNLILEFLEGKIKNSLFSNFFRNTKKSHILFKYRKVWLRNFVDLIKHLSKKSKEFDSLFSLKLEPAYSDDLVLKVDLNFQKAFSLMQQGFDKFELWELLLEEKLEKCFEEFNSSEETTTKLEKLTSYRIKRIRQLLKTLFYFTRGENSLNANEIIEIINYLFDSSVSLDNGFTLDLDWLEHYFGEGEFFEIENIMSSGRRLIRMRVNYEEIDDLLF